MMDNYNQTRINSNKLQQLDDELPIKFQETNKFFNAVEEFTVNKKYNFGANILNTKTMSTSSMASTTNSSFDEQVVKTNNGIIKALTLPPTADVGLEESLIAGIPVSASDVDALKIDCNQEQFMCSKDNDENRSFQTEDDSSQLSHDSTNSRQISKEQEDTEDNRVDETDESSSDSDYSDLSGLSDMSGREWKPINHRPLNWVQKQIHSGANPREILSKFLPSSAQRISPELTDMTLWRILASMLSEPPRRKKLSYINTFEDVIELLHKSKNIIVLTGAGVSVSCGIPDFRSADGIYSRLAKDYPDLPDPQAMFDINYFSRDPRPFYKFAREIYPGQFKPSPCHNFIKILEQKQKLLRNYTQNIDTLEQVAGIKNVIECHGSFSTASCTKCKYKCDADSIRSEIFAQRIPVCPRCQPNVEQSLDASEPVSENGLRQLVENGIMKPDIVFFGEGLPDEFHTVMASDKDKCDLLIVMGSSLKVRPVALIPSSIPNHVPQILINREQLHHLEFDVELLGDGDVIINQICHQLGGEWKDICFSEDILKESRELMPLTDNLEDDDTGKEVSLDVDSIAINSNKSSEVILQSSSTSTVAYSHSGFESSSCAKKNVEFLSPDDLDEPMESTSFGGSCDYRHLSIDSSKDSGILNDASNSALAPSFSNFVDSADINKSLNMPASTTQTISNKSVDTNLHSTKTAEISSSEAEKQRLGRHLKYQTVADRLLKGTYYVHDNTASYAFPGAQVSWCSDSEGDDENLVEYEDNHCNDDDTNHAPLSPLMTPSVENEMVKAIASTSASQHHSSTGISFSNTVSSNSCLSEPKLLPQLSQQQSNTKRNLTDMPVDESLDSPSKSSHIEAKYNSEHASYINISPPPHKRRRDSTEHMSNNTPKISLESS